MNRSSKFIAFALVAAMLLLSLPASLLAEPARTAPEGYNEHDYSKCVSFLEIEDEDGVKNGTKLNPDYDPDDPGTWLAETEWGEEIGFFFDEIEGEFRLTQVRCYDLGLVGTIDFEDCTELVRLYCGENMLDGVIVLGCTSLEILIPWCNEDLTELDVTQCPALRYLQCEDCSITELDLSNNPALTDLYVVFNPLGELDISQCSNLQNLDCMACGLTELDVSNNPLLESLYADWNHISELDISNNQLLIYLGCDGTDLTELDTSANPELRYVTCADTNCTAFDFSGNHYLVLDIVRAEEGGFIGCTVDDGLNDSIVIAEPW